MFGILLGYRFRRIVKRPVGVLVNKLQVLERIGQVAAERLQHRENNPPRGGVDRDPLNIVENSVTVRILLLVEFVEVHDVQQDIPLDSSFRDIVDVSPGGIVHIDHVKVEIGAAELVGIEVVDVFHHQVPGGEPGGEVGPLDQLEDQGLRGVDPVGRKLSNLKDLAVNRVVVSHGQNFVVVKGGVEGDVPQSLVKGVFRFGEFAGLFDFLEVAASHEVIPEQGHHRGDGLDTADAIVGGGHLLVEAVGPVVGVNTGGKGLAGSLLKAWHRVVYMGVVFSQVLKGQNIARFREIPRFVGHPHLDLIDGDPRPDHRQRTEGFIIIVTEILGEEEVAVGVVVGGRNFEVGHLGSPFGFHGFGLPLMLREKGGEGQLPELHLGFHPEEVGGSRDQRSAQGQRYVSGLDSFNDFILFTGVLEVHLILIVKGRLGIVVDPHVHLGADLAHDVHLDLLVEIKGGHLTEPDGNGRVVGFIHLVAKAHLHIPLGLDVDGIAAENPVEGFTLDGEPGNEPPALFHFGEVLPLPPVITDRLAEIIIDIVVE